MAAFVEQLQVVVGPDLAPVFGREAREREDVRLCLDQQLRSGWKLVSELGLDLLVVGLGEDHGHERGDHPLGGSGEAAEEVSHGVGVPALPARTGQDGRDGLFQALAGIGDDVGDTGQPTGDEAVQERRPACPVFGREDVEGLGELAHLRLGLFH